MDNDRQSFRSRLQMDGAGTSGEACPEICFLPFQKRKKTPAGILSRVGGGSNRASDLMCVPERNTDLSAVDYLNAGRLGFAPPQWQVLEGNGLLGSALFLRIGYPSN